jgi:hypothetical protein
MSFMGNKTKHLFSLLTLWGIAVAAVACGDGPLPSSPTSIIGSTPDSPGGGATLGYVEDIKPLLDADCTRCHNTRTHEAGVDLSSFAAVSRVVQAGSANSLLIRVSRRGGSMYSEWRGDATGKAELVRRWVVDYQAQQTR